jgi:putative transposase
VLAHHRRRVVHFNVTEHPTTVWAAQQIVDAFPDDSAPLYLLRDRDQVYGQKFRHRVKGMGIEEVLTAPHSPWQNPFAERLIGSIRRECLNHVLVLGERHLRRTLTRYFSYYQQARTHLALDKDAPDFRTINRSEVGRIVQLAEVGGLQHRYIRQAAQSAIVGLLDARRHPPPSLSYREPLGPRAVSGLRLPTVYLELAHTPGARISDVPAKVG